MRSDALIQIRSMTKRYETRAKETVLALTDVNLDIGKTEFLTVVGPSGCGKTTLLRILSGLESHTEGTLLIDGTVPSGPRPDISMVFQQATLLPWRTVLQNVLLPRQLQKTMSPQVVERARALLDMAGLSEFENKYPSELSGGMQQRASICRALICDPKILLMDEPFGALDAMTRETMNLELMRIWSAQKKAVIFITHSIPEAVFLGDRVLVMTPRPGRISRIIDVNIPRPRDRSSFANPVFNRICDEIREIFDTQGSGATNQENSNVKMAVSF
ncbi:ABC transporter ATP-binding protein [Telmatospirillum sp. J64-1]|uniref:ABC transporter ATP-binding protein n=1 Tax=Telmatospirillum sp. J64-1 TaxID=2502183 RepID=UPI00115E3161|nr:ABC transporter ATP-binding protein [Telmatospirillum sp. J64-1]